MSEDSRDPTAIDNSSRNAKVQNAKANDAKVRESNNTGAKWAAGAAVAVLLLGGGYYALKTVPAARTNAEVASTDAGYGASSTTPPIAAAPYAGDQSNATTSSTVTTTSTETRTTATPARKRVTTTTAAANMVPETVVGITPVSATADDTSNEVVVTGERRPVWARTPSARRLSAMYPENALERGREGEASVHCTVLDSGALDCVRASEMPANSGFGLAAMRVARTFRHASRRADGSDAVGTPVNLRVVFRISNNDHHMPPHT